MTTSDQTQMYSHPDRPVRHSYPLAVKEEGISTALKLCLQTMPCILTRLGVLLAFTLGAIVWLALCGGIAALFSSKEGGGGGGLILFMLGVGIPAGVYAWLRHYVLYLLKLGHIAVLTRLITDGSLPQGVNQVQFGKQIVTERFAQVNVLFVVDSLVTGVVRAFNRTLDWIAGLIPIPGLEGAMKVVGAVVHNATTYIDETFFSYNIARGDENVWRSSADALVYYGQNVKAVLKTAVWGLLLEYALTFAAFVIALIPAWLIGQILPGTVAGFAWVIAIVLAIVVRSAFLNPIFLTMVALTFHKHAQGQAIDISMAETLGRVSDKFRELSEKAKNWMAGEKGTQPQTAA